VLIATAVRDVDDLEGFATTLADVLVHGSLADSERHRVSRRRRPDAPRARR
jgi:hypothetical protein